MSARLEKLLLQALVEKPATVAGPTAGDKAAQELAKTLDDAARRVLGRALSIREVDAGSCNGCELEIHALNNPVYDLERFGLKFVASPRHADVLLVTGPVTANMKTALERTYHATPDPKWVVALGDCACSGGCSRAAMPVSARSRPWCRSIFASPAARRGRSRS
jgi:Ni,Fe-hydrogenase III small subunit